jgi:DNA-binding CsgD family transcriptional regulator
MARSFGNSSSTPTVTFRATQPPQPPHSSVSGVSGKQPPVDRDIAPRERIRTIVLCVSSLLREGPERAIWSAPELELVPPDATSNPDVALWIAESGAALSQLGKTPMRKTMPRVLLDAAGRLGPFAAGLHAFLGYLPPEVNDRRLAACLRTVAAGQPDAPRPHLMPLIRVLNGEPLQRVDREILRLLARGYAYKRISHDLKISKRTLERHMTRLLDQFQAGDGRNLGTIAVALGFGWPWQS